MNIGDIVMIRECHKQPELIGLEAKVVALVDPTLAKYPVQVQLNEVPGVFGFREDELEPKADIPDAFKGALGG